MCETIITVSITMTATAALRLHARSRHNVRSLVNKPVHGQAAAATYAFVG